jgi:hypothetical protein
MEQTQAIEQLKEKVFRKPDLTVTRIPYKTLERLRDFAAEEFASDYGMTIKFLLDFYDGFFPTGLDKIQLELEVIKGDIAELKKHQPKEEEKKPHKNMMGQRIEV